VEKQGIRIAFLSYTYGLNGIPIPEGKEYLLNLVRLNRSSGDLSLIEEQVRIAKQEKRADIIVACLHWGQEFESYPTQQYIDRGHRLLEMGIDIIVGNHAHGLQPAEQYPFTDPYTGQQKQGLILYALGDLLSWHPALNTRLGGLAKIRLQKGRVSGKPITIISGVEMKPTYLYGAIRREQCSDYRVMDLEALAAQAEAGTAPVALSRKQRSEVLRLRDLAAKVLRTNQLFKP
jgi:poly-gamma-glutamate synthesis protein (capsule biosynthesis protein)